MEHVLCLIWLSNCLKRSYTKISKLLKIYGSPENIYNTKDFSAVRLSDKDIARLRNKDLSDAKAIIEKTARLGGKIITYDNEAYPKILKQIAKPPYILYVKGKLPLFDDVLTIGIVGTRRTTEYGLLAAKNISASLAASGVVVISGMAAGIDAAALWASLDNGGVTVGVIASGIDIVYPRENAELYKAVAYKGCIISEYPPGTPPVRYNFPERNRIIAGLSHGVLVAEAPKKSGALITAHHALDEGRNVFAVPRNITDIGYEGTNILIGQGAKAVLNAADIISEYPYAKLEIVQKPEIVKETAIKEPDGKFKSLSGAEKEIAELLSGGAMQIDELSRRLNMPVGKLNTHLIMLEMKGIAERMPQSAYKLKE